MKQSEVLIKPILTEKANNQQEKLGRYSFKVSRNANKLEIKKAVEELDIELRKINPTDPVLLDFALFFEEDKTVSSISFFSISDRK